MPFASDSLPVQWCLANTWRVQCWPDAEQESLAVVQECSSLANTSPWFPHSWCHALVLGTRKSTSQKINSLPAGAHQPGGSVHLPWKKVNDIHTSAGAAWDCLCGDTVVPWAHLGMQTATRGRAVPLWAQALTSPPASWAELAASSNPEPLLQEVSPDAGTSLADFKDLLEMSRYNTYL